MANGKSTTTIVGVAVLVAACIGLMFLYQLKTSRLTEERRKEMLEAVERIDETESAKDAAARAAEEKQAETKKEPVEPMEEVAERYPDKLIARITTNRGPIVLELFQDKAPITVANFVNLAIHGFYDNLKFHRVIGDFMIQGGCPLGTGTGGPGYDFEDEFVPELRFDRKGLLAMANSGPATNGSQFFITHVPTPHLNDRHTIFGEVLEGQDIVDDTRQGDVMEKVEIAGDYSALFEQQADNIAKWNKHIKR